MSLLLSTLLLLFYFIFIIIVILLNITFILKIKVLQSIQEIEFLLGLKHLILHDEICGVDNFVFYLPQDSVL